MVPLILNDNICQIQELHGSSTAEEIIPLDIAENSVCTTFQVTPRNGYQDAILCATHVTD